MADKKEAVAPRAAPKDDAELDLALSILEELKADGLGTMEISVVVGHLQLLVLEEVKEHMVAYRPVIKGKERRSRAPTFEDARIVGRKHDLYDVCAELSRFDIPDICRALRDLEGKYWKEQPTEAEVRKLITRTSFIRKDGLKKGRQAYVLVRDDKDPQVKEAD